MAPDEMTPVGGAIGASGAMPVKVKPNTHMVDDFTLKSARRTAVRV
jgi:hypothetical protein